MTKTKLKALSAILLVAILLVAIFVANFGNVQRAFAEEVVDGEVDDGVDVPDDSDYVETLPDDSEESIGGLAGLFDNLVTWIIIGVVFVNVIFPCIILGIVVSARREKRK